MLKLPFPFSSRSKLPILAESVPEVAETVQVTLNFGVPVMFAETVPELVRNKLVGAVVFEMDTVGLTNSILMSVVAVYPVSRVMFRVCVTIPSPLSGAV